MLDQFYVSFACSLAHSLARSSSSLSLSSFSKMRVEIKASTPSSNLMNRSPSVSFFSFCSTYSYADSVADRSTYSDADSDADRVANGISISRCVGGLGVRKRETGVPVGQLFLNALRPCSAIRSSYHEIVLSIATTTTLCPPLLPFLPSYLITFCVFHTF